MPQLLGKLPTRVAACARDLLEHAVRLQAKALEYEQEIKIHVGSNALACRVQTRLGIGPITASALVATVGNGHDFKNGRQFAAWLGLVPRQYSSGGKTRLGHITKRGDPYLRTLLVMGARAVLQRAVSLTDPLSRWALAVLRCGSGAGITVPASRSPPRTPVSRGRCWPRSPSLSEANARRRAIEQEIQALHS